ncbi:MAG TPA: glycosyltransferase family 2 protein [Candidatus Acidoferrum sp.]|nr:glycosyltransferase family 2 protein [Candidatus Acidoferrum sp.]
MNRISVCMITKNEEKHLSRALQSVADVADEVIVVDCGSTDRTQALARELGAKVFIRAWTNYGDQRNFAAAQAENEWIFALDADEALSNELRESLLNWKQSDPDSSVYEVPRLAQYLGGWIRHSGWYPNYQSRLYKRSETHYEGIVHESLVFRGKRGRLKGDLLHYTIDTFPEHEKKVEEYSTLAAQKMFEQGRRSWRAALWFATPWTFFQSFILRAGFLDGHRGALIAQMAARSVRLKFRRLARLVAAERAKSEQ